MRKANRIVWPVLFYVVVLLAPFLNPVALADVSGSTVTVAASATDNVGVVGVRFLLNGAQLAAEDTTAPYAIIWDSTTVPNGSYTLTAVARDAAGNLGISSPVVVTVANSGGGGDTTAPTVLMTGPANGSTVSATLSVTATASDGVGVAGVQFLLDGAPLAAEDTTSPYSVSWTTTTAANGSHQLAARARDAAGNQTTSAAITVIVDNTSGPEPGPEEATGGGTVNLSIERAAPGFRQIRARSDAGDELALHIDQQPVVTVAGNSLDYSWDIRPLLGSHQIEVFANGGSDLVASASMFYDVTSLSVPTVTLNVVAFPIVGATLIEARADVGVASRLELYIDGELRLSQLGDAIDYAWAPGTGAHQILFVAYDRTGVATSVSLLYVP